MNRDASSPKKVPAGDLSGLRTESRLEQTSSLVVATPGLRMVQKLPHGLGWRLCRWDSLQELRTNPALPGAVEPAGSQRTPGTGRRGVVLGSRDVSKALKENLAFNAMDKWWAAQSEQDSSS